MKLISTLLLSIFTLLSVSSQDALNVELVGSLELGERGNDIWGYVDPDGIEYALIGSFNATHIVSLENPAEPTLIKSIPGTESPWRDIKTFNNHAYVVADRNADGLLIIDLSDIDSITHRFIKPELTIGTSIDTLEKCHNIYIDEEGVAYLAGCNNGLRGIIMMDIKTDPDTALFLGAIDDRYVHDVYVRNDTLLSSEIFSGSLAIYDVSDKSAPELISSILTTREFTHNAWLSADGSHVFTTDEKVSATVNSINISNLSSPEIASTYKTPTAMDGRIIPHNVHVLENFLVTSWYTEGVTIADYTDPTNIVEVGYYDTFEMEDSIQEDNNWFSGCWGAYPFLPSGLLLASDIQSGLYVLDPTYVQAARLTGIVKDMNTGSIIRDASVSFVSAQGKSDRTDLEGRFRIGSPSEGNLSIQVIHPAYSNKIVEVNLVAGQSQEIEVLLDQKTLNVVIIDENGDPVPFAQATLIDTETGEQVEYQAGDDGTLEAKVGSVKAYSLIVGKWGYLERFQPFTTSTSEDEITITLIPGYEDSFSQDYGWSLNNNAISGHWTRTQPRLLFRDGNIIQPGTDSDDAGNLCYITGNDEFAGGEDDVDAGFNFLTSPPMDLRDEDRIDVSFDYFFHVSGGRELPNDTLRVSLVSGIDTLILIEATDSSELWISTDTMEIFPSDIPFSDSVFLFVEIGDPAPIGHLTEGGIDNINVELGSITTSTENYLSEEEIAIYPSLIQVGEHIIIKGSEAHRISRVEVFNLSGQKVKSNLSGIQSHPMDDLKPGMYLVVIDTEIGSVTRKLTLVD